MAPSQIQNCTEFLQEVLPQLRMQWKGFRKVRRQVCRRIAARMSELSLSTFDEYYRYLQENEGEWFHLDTLCRITISRFYRDGKVFDCIRHEVLPELKDRAFREKRTSVSCLSIGCASGEEVYSLSCLWHSMDPNIDITITGIDVNENMLRRARNGVYEKQSFRDMPSVLLEQCFEHKNKKYFLKEVYRRGTSFICRDIREWLPEKTFDIILCRNLVFMYYDETLQKEMLLKILQCMHGGSFLILGNHEKLPVAVNDLKKYKGQELIYLFEK